MDDWTIDQDIYCDATEKSQLIKPRKDYDLSRLESSTNSLKTFKDIGNLKKIAEQRDQWRILCTRIQKAAEALQSDDYDAERR